MVKKEDWYTVEGSAELVNKVTMGKTPVYAGLYVEQYKDNPEQFIKALQMCRAKSKGAMVFDIVHIINYGWWNHLATGLKIKHTLNMLKAEPPGFAFYFLSPHIRKEVN